MKNPNIPPQTDALTAPAKPPGRRARIVFYAVLCGVASLIPQAMEIANYPELEGEGVAVVRALGGLLALAVLTFPAGLVPALLWWLLVMTGIATPFEGVALLLPAFIVVGYLQWFVWIPRFVLRNSKTASNERSSSAVS